MEKSSYSAYSYSYSNINGKTEESIKSFSKDSKGEEKFKIVKKKDKKVSKKVEGQKAKDSNTFIIKSNDNIEKEMNKQEVYRMLLADLGVEYEQSIKEFLKSKEHKELLAGKFDDRNISHSKKQHGG